jgi:hypothetical protein
VKIAMQDVLDTAAGRVYLNDSQSRDFQTAAQHWALNTADQHRSNTARPMQKAGDLASADVRSGIRRPARRQYCALSAVSHCGGRACFMQVTVGLQATLSYLLKLFLIHPVHAPTYKSDACPLKCIITRNTPQHITLDQPGLCNKD